MSKAKSYLSSLSDSLERAQKSAEKHALENEEEFNKARGELDALKVILLSFENNQITGESLPYKLPKAEELLDFWKKYFIQQHDNIFVNPDAFSAEMKAFAVSAKETAVNAYNTFRKKLYPEK